MASTPAAMPIIPSHTVFALDGYSHVGTIELKLGVFAEDIIEAIRNGQVVGGRIQGWDAVVLANVRSVCEHFGLPVPAPDVVRSMRYGATRLPEREALATGTVRFTTR